MLKIMLVFFALTALAVGSPIATPLIGKLNPQPGLAPANTEHAGYIGAITPIFHSGALIASGPLIPSTYTTAEHLPFAYPVNYLSTYSSPIEASAYRIAY